LVILIGPSQPEKKKEKLKLDEATQNRSFYFGKFPYKLLETNPHLYTSAQVHLLPHHCLSKSDSTGMRFKELTNSFFHVIFHRTLSNNDDKFLTSGWLFI
jgi:hypothetical protein